MWRNTFGASKAAPGTLIIAGPWDMACYAVRVKVIFPLMHFEESRHDPGIRIVLECIPLRSVLEQIEAALRRIIAPIPTKPAPVQTVTAEPHIMTPDEASTSQ